ncbi:LpqB family beta-propeller domain-containing protein [Kocuria sp.]|uniref:LpqB family beta-propeller domain-containing protein n=1 Tax=Kocuria sp. TaxID=1871328 RepID=UPI0026DD4AE1|nr:LpqB family beta-propeller domain-containing protein [Kocuria sp.]MDO4918651.1 LpqB family beta-propeller domain-containing protein [Kocuria sp.]
MSPRGAASTGGDPAAEAASISRTRGRRCATAATVLAVAFALSACGAMPSSGPVHRVIEPTGQSQQSDMPFNPQAPRAGATAQEVVEGFLAAGVGAQDDYSVARQYLTPQLATTWKPDARVLIHSGEPTTVPRLNEGEFRTTTEVSSELGANGVLTAQPKGSTRVLDFALTSVDGQWRISRAPDGVLVPETDFRQIFSPVDLYYYSAQDGKTLVPDPRWFAKRPTASTAAVRALLDGPASYLGDAVKSAIPQAASLSRSSVPVSGGTAAVDLSLSNFDPADVEQARRMERQLRATLRSVPTVEDLHLTVDDAPVESSGNQDVDPASSATVPNRQIGVSDNQLAFFQGGQTEKIQDLSLPAGAVVTKPAMGAEASTFGFVDTEDSAVYTVSPGKTPQRRWSGDRPTRPSFDTLGWVWGSDRSGAVHAVPAAADGSGGTVSAEWLQGQHVASLRISREGSRALVVTTDDSSSRAVISIAGVVRDASGRPTGLEKGNAVAADVDVNTAQWIGANEFVTTALNQDGNAQPRRYTVAGEHDDLPSLTGVTSIAGGNGSAAVYGASDGRLYMLTGSSWALQSEDVTDTAFAG